MDNFNDTDDFNNTDVYNQGGYQTGGYQPPPDDPDQVPLTVGEWLLTFVIFAIPCVGIVMMFVWAFASGGNKNRKNYCRANLILVAAIILLYIVLVCILIATGTSEVLLETLEQQ